MRTGDNVKLLLHNLFFISSFSDGGEKKYLERNKSRRVKKKKNYRLITRYFFFSLCRTGYFLHTPKAIFAVLKKVMQSASFKRLPHFDTPAG